MPGTANLPGVRAGQGARLEAPNDAKKVAEVTGHSVAVLLRHYQRPTPAKLREAVRRAGIRSTRERKGQVVQFGAQNPGTRPDGDGG